ncbi:MAG: hypothetical protein GEV12_14395 [Micromonosporaceae bacterium]|nr:hypothetical protein [Micromonosporaceae bacterium]
MSRFWRSLRTDRATRWRTAFLALTALVIGMEIRAATDGDPTTDPYTDLTVRHVPWELALFVGGGGLVWLFGHFGIRYWRKHRRAKPAE